MALGYRTLVVGWAVLAVACGPESGESDGDGGGGGSGAEDGGSDGAADHTGGAEGEGTASSADDGSSADGDGSGEGSSGGNVQCDLEELTCEQGNCVDPNVISCGFVTGTDSVETWEAAQQCVLDAVADQMPFVAGFTPLPPDGLGGFAYGFGARAGGEYETFAIDLQDVGYGSDSASEKSCGTIEPMPGCTLGRLIEYPCLVCTDASAPTPICGE